mmetsp:Transcript_29282/g.75470  ORF Transcript_29282/g.75470 Transcript_29282/m.75470 type:complete len:111 (+) Transcript_29282:2760-3092(+)
MEELKLAWCKSLSSASLSAIAAQCAKIRFLEVGWWKEISDDALLTMLRTCSQVETLYLGGCDSLSERTLREVTHLKHLRWLEVYGCGRVTVSSIQYIKQQIPRCHVSVQK